MGARPFLPRTSGVKATGTGLESASGSKQDSRGRSGAPLKIAVVGAGVSGLVCALGLGREHDVVVFESAGRSGGHAHTVVVNEQSRSVAIDVGFIVFNFAHYPHLSSLFDRLGVVSQPSDMSFQRPM